MSVRQYPKTREDYSCGLKNFPKLTLKILQNNTLQKTY